MFVWESFTFTFFYLSKVKNTALDINAHYFHFSMIVCVPQVKNDIASAIFRRVIKVFKAFVNVHTHTRTHTILLHTVPSMNKICRLTSLERHFECSF